MFTYVRVWIPAYERMSFISLHVTSKKFIFYTGLIIIRFSDDAF